MVSRLGNVENGMSEATRTLVTLETNKFNTTDPKEYFINPGCFGDDLCMWMIGQFQIVGIECDAEPQQEDFGWYFNFRIGKERYRIVIGFRPADGSDPAVWILWLERAVTFWSGIFGKNERITDVNVVRRIDEVLDRMDGVSNIQWHLKADFERGDEEAGVSF